MSDRVVVETLPKCDIHKYELGHDSVPARYDAKTRTGQWANMCEDCYPKFRYFHDLGTGKGQRLVTRWENDIQIVNDYVNGPDFFADHQDRPFMVALEHKELNRIEVSMTWSDQRVWNCTFLVIDGKAVRQ